MAAAFLDTSALAKLYHDEIGSAFLEQLLLRTHHTAFISRLGADSFVTADREDPLRSIGIEV